MSTVAALARAVIIRAIRDVVHYRNSTSMPQQRLYRAARDWMFTDHISDYFDPSMEIPTDMNIEEARESLRRLNHLTSYLGVCAILELDPIDLRRRVRHLRPHDLTALGKSGNRIWDTATMRLTRRLDH